MEYCSHVWEGSTNTALLNRVESKAFHLINSPPLTDCLDYLRHRHNVASLSIFYRYFHADCSSELANCMPPPSRGLAAQDFLFLLFPILSIFLMKELTSIFTLSFLILVNSGTHFLCLSKLDCAPISIFLLLSSLQGLAKSGIFFLFIFVFP